MGREGKSEFVRGVVGPDSREISFAENAASGENSSSSMKSAAEVWFVISAETRYPFGIGVTFASIANGLVT
jgi:hypothetical protein